MKKIFAVFCSTLLIAALFAGCKKKETPASSSEDSQASSSTSSLDVSKMTDQEIADHNAQLDEEELQLLQFSEPQTGDEIAVMKTSEGEIRIRLFREQAPKTVENFVTLANEGYYNGLTFHRVINEFMIQSGDPTGTGRGGKSIYTNEQGQAMAFEDEFTTDLWNFRGALSMANAGADTNTSQFFIVQTREMLGATADQLAKYQFPQKVIEKYSEVGGTPGLDWKHTVFGQVIEGMDVVDKIAAVETDENDKPVEPVIIESLKIETVS